MFRPQWAMPAMALVALTSYSIGRAPAPARASFQVLGAGNKSCEVWTKESGGPNHSGNVEWVLGYVTSLLQERAMRAAAGEDLKPLDRTDAKAIVGFVDKYCEDRPSRPVSDAAYSLLGKLGHQWPAPTPPKREYR
jgi:hypothetical protein